MSAGQTVLQESSFRSSVRLSGEPGEVAAAELVGFVDDILRQAASAGARLVSLTMHLLEPGTSSRVTGEAVLLSKASAEIWRVTVTDEAGAIRAEFTATLAPAGSTPVLAPAQDGDAKARKEPQARRTRIAEAARDVFAEKGYTAATMREIAAAAGLHVPTMYQYVRSKEEILELVYAWTINQAVDEMEAVLSAEGPAAERMDAIVRRLHDVNQKLRRGTLVMNRETRSLSQSARERVLGHYAGMVRRIGEVVAQGQQEGAFRQMDPDLAGVFIDALADVWVLRPFAVGHADYETYAAELAAFVRSALTCGCKRSPDKPGRNDGKQQKETLR